MGHDGLSKRRVIVPPSISHHHHLDNSIPQLSQPPSNRPSLAVVASAARLDDYDQQRHAFLGSLFPLRPRHRLPAAAAGNPQFPLMSAGQDDSVGGRALLQDFLTFLNLKGAHYAVSSIRLPATKWTAFTSSRLVVQYCKLLRYNIKIELSEIAHPTKSERFTHLKTLINY